MNTEPAHMEYRYLGDRQTAAEHKGRLCRAVRRADGKCVRGRNGSMLIEWEDGTWGVVLGRLLRKLRDTGQFPV